MSLLRLDRLHKSFHGVPVLKELSLELDSGEALGLVGENGAGKSTLINLLSGVFAPDSGEIWWLGERRRFRTPREALASGIATIHQELSYCGGLSVAENLLLGEPWPRRPWGAVDWRRLYAEAGSRLERLGFGIHPTAFMSGLRAAERQEAAIARVLAKHGKLLILDEPTAALSGAEAARLFAHLRRLKAEGVAVIYVSHRLDEVLALTDRVAVLRDGELAALHATGETSAERIARAMTGREAAPRASPPGFAEPGPVLLEAEGLACEGLSAGASFQACAGEVLGIAGLEGSGRLELVRALFGLLPLRGGCLRIEGKPCRFRGPEDARRAGIAYVPEERKRQALVADHSVGESIAIGFSDLMACWGWIDRASERKQLLRALDDFAIRSSGVTQAVGRLSGGNQQKAVLARNILRQPRILILNEPTRGVDVASKLEIHERIHGLARAGKCVILTTSDVPELVKLSSRVLVIHEGALYTELSGESLSEEAVLLSQSGLSPSGSGRGIG